MINKNEIRIGNKLLFDSEIDTVTSIYNNGVDGEFKSRWWYDRLHGIPLTPEILEKSGGKAEKPCGWYSINQGKHRQQMMFYWPENELMHYADGEQCPIIQYLHQLQNLIFVLMGEELTINI